MKYKLVYVTAGDEAEARKIGKTLVEERFAACINIHPIRSIYRQGEELREESEAAMFIKTRVGLITRVIKRIRELHSYETPCIISLPIEKGHGEFLRWIGESTKMND